MKSLLVRLNIYKMYLSAIQWTVKSQINLYFIGIGFGGLEAINSMGGFGGVGRMGGR